MTDRQARYQAHQAQDGSTWVVDRITSQVVLTIGSNPDPAERWRIAERTATRLNREAFQLAMRNRRRLCAMVLLVAILGTLLGFLI